ncbi:hypothetical protein EVAR_68463_1 [Eumeta japonica]|uniref:Uncharacterized protein n=1 Tax=Eumeta variegata TaxID=151549 RepID=A0A4C2A5I6_EUMVA|nr:hypothetical protein EVAR_68463_1 [Eumeta japonica]
MLCLQKKGGNVKTIPPYKPVMHDSHSSDSSGEKDGETSPLASESGTPTHSGKSKGVFFLILPMPERRWYMRSTLVVICVCVPVCVNTYVVNSFYDG